MDPNRAADESPITAGSNSHPSEPECNPKAGADITTPVASNNSSELTTDFVLDDEALVSYLDGELTSDEKLAIETRLRMNSAASSRLEQLRQTWDLLDQLPIAGPNVQLTQTTMEMLAVSIQQEMHKTSTLTNYVGWKISMAVALLTTFCLGFLGMRASQSQSNQLVLEELHILADWHSFSDIVSFEWLDSMKSLRTQMENFAVYHPEEDLSSADLKANNSVGAVPSDYTQREVWLKSLPDSKRREISNSWTKFGSASPKKKERARSIADQVYRSPNPEQLLQLARIFRSILDNSIGGRRDKLTQPFSSDSDMQTQIELRLEELEETINVKIGSAYGKALPQQDREAIRGWVDVMEERYFQPRSQRAQSSVILALKNLESGYSVIQDADIDELFESLTPQAQEILANLDEYLFSVYIADWVVEAMSNPRPQPKEPELIAQYVLMQPEEREEVDYMDSLNARERLASKLNRRSPMSSEVPDAASAKDRKSANGSSPKSHNQGSVDQ